MKPKDHFGNPLIEQRKLAAGQAAVILPDRGIIAVAGPDRLEWLHSMLSQNLRSLAVAEGAEALLLDPQGHIERVIHLIDDGEQTWLWFEGEAEKFTDWLDMMIFRRKVTVQNRSADFAVVGKVSEGVPQAFQSNGVALIWNDPWPRLVPGGFHYAKGAPPRWSWTESLVSLERTSEVFETIEPAGTMAYDALRIAAHRPQQSSEVDEKALPHEFDWLTTAVHLSKGCYRGQETVAKVHNLGHPPRRLIFMHLDGSGHDIPDRGDEIFVVTADGTLEETSRGKVTSVAQHYEMGPIAMGLVSRSVPETATIMVRTRFGDVNANQEVIVPSDAGKAGNIKQKKLLMGGGH